MTSKYTHPGTSVRMFPIVETPLRARNAEVTPIWHFWQYAPWHGAYSKTITPPHAGQTGSCQCCTPRFIGNLADNSLCSEQTGTNNIANLYDRNIQFLRYNQEVCLQVSLDQDNLDMLSGCSGVLVYRSSRHLQRFPLFISFQYFDNGCFWRWIFLEIGLY